MPVDVTKVRNRRQVHFERPRDILADAEALSRTPIQQLGNMSLGQSCGHLATWMNLSIDGGIPMDVPRWLKFLARLFRSYLLSRPLAPGYKLPESARKILIPEPELGVEEGLRRLAAAVARLETEEQRVPSPLLGQLSRADWDRLHCRHAELHMSLLRPARAQ